MKNYFKRLICILAVMVFGMSMTALADDAVVTYDGKAHEFVSGPEGKESLNDLFPNFKNVMPGDTITQKITLKNSKSNNFDAKISLRSLGGIEEEEFLSQMNLKIKSLDGKEVSSAAADKKGGLADWKVLATVKPGAEGTLEVELTVPLTMGNEFQNKTGKLQWEFKVEEVTRNRPSGGNDRDDDDDDNDRPAVVTIDDNETPLDSLIDDGENGVIITDNEVPLVAMPKLGDIGIGGYIVGLLALLIVAGGAIYARKRLDTRK